jgi:hypothetical protein
VPSHALQIILEMQSQRTSQKRAVKKILFFELQNAFFSFFFSLTPPTFNPNNFLIDFKQFKMLEEHHLKF